MMAVNNSMPNIPQIQNCKSTAGHFRGRQAPVRAGRSDRPSAVTICPRLLRLCFTDHGHDQVFFHACGNAQMDVIPENNIAI